MYRRTARGNRLGLVLTGLLLMIAGAALFAWRYGWIRSVGGHTPIYPEPARRWMHDNGDWFWPVAAAIAVLFGLIYLRWLLVQFRVDRVRRLQIDTEGDAASGADGAGRTRMPATAVTDVVEDEIVALRGVRRVSASMSGHTDAPELWVRVATDGDADLGRIRQDVVDTVIADARACLDLPTLPTYLRLVVTNRDTPRDVR